MTVGLAGMPAHADTKQALDQHELRHLKQAEQEVAWLRWFGMAVWAMILLTGDQAASLGAWLVYAGGFAYTIWAYWRIDHSASIQLSARLTSIGDPVLAALMCAVTGGIGSLFYPFFYFTLLATAFRFGGRAAAAGLLLNATLTILLFVGVPAAGQRMVDLAISLVYLIFSAWLGMMMARWAQQNLDLAQSRESAFRNARDQARRLLQRLVRAQEEERRLVASDLHDRLGHHLFVVQQGLSSLADDPGIRADTRQRLTKLSEEAQICTSDVREMMNDLRPTVLDDFGFCEAVREYVARMKADVPFKIGLSIDDSAEPAEADTQAMLFRIVQESLVNIRKHAKATRVEISLVGAPERDEFIVLTISDNGEGFDPQDAEPGHLGLLTMRERAEALGGHLEISDTFGGGTTIAVRLPAGSAL